MSQLAERPLALVTGASSGIGEAFARELSTRGYDLVLVARNHTRLCAIAAELPPPTIVLTADLTRPEDLATVEKFITEQPIDLLVNNAGSGNFGPVAEQEPHWLSDTISLNATAPARLTRAALPHMIATGTGGVLNISSIASDVPMPHMAAYAAAKAFIDSFSRSLHQELRTTGITVTCIRPGLTRTGFHDRAGQPTAHIKNRHWTTPAHVATQALNAHQRGATIHTIPKRPRWLRLTIRRIDHLRRHLRSNRSATGIPYRTPTKRLTATPPASVID